MRMRALATVGALAAGLAVAGCTSTGSSSSSSKDFTGQEKQVADAVSSLSTAGSRRKPEDICGKLVTAELRSKLAQGGKSCEAEVKKAVEDADAFDLEVTDVQISGATARASVTTKDRGTDVKRTFTLQRQSGDWRFSSFG